ncbi:FecR family protein [Candidatus Gracilibacteria bacterium]|nr:FecR family protein [Candidatus Gracilibacteria bacterium]
MKLGRRPHRSSFSRRRRQRRNFIPLITFLVAFGFLMWLGGKFLTYLFSDERTEAASVEIQVHKGRAEFSFPDSETWTPAYTEQKFLEGDSIRTGGNSRVSLEFMSGNVIFLDSNSEIFLEELEEKSSGKKIVRIELVSGRIWARVSDDDFNSESNSKFEVETPRVLLHVRGTIFDLSTSNSQDSIRLIKGSTDVDVFLDEENKESKNIKMGVGQKLVVSPTNITRLEAGEDILEILDTGFIESEWHLQNLEGFFPQEVAQIRRRIEITVPKITQPNLEISTELEPPKVLSPENGSVIPASQDTLKVEGTSPLQAVQIIVNGYTLTRFQPGDRKWAYFASKKFGTLVPGENKYSVIAVTRDGKRSAPEEITVMYEGEANQEATGEPKIESTISEFKAPVITRPAVASLEDPYQTSSSTITISGIVDPKTNAVEINGFRLQKFQPGNTEFTYFASADVPNPNLIEGENIYEVIAFGPDGKTSSTKIKIVYTPLAIES